MLDFSLFKSFWSENGLGSHFAKGNYKGNAIVSKMDFLAMVQPVASQPAAGQLSTRKHHQQLASQAIQPAAWILDTMHHLMYYSQHNIIFAKEKQIYIYIYINIYNVQYNIICTS